MSSATTRNAQLASEKPRRSSGDGGKGRGTRTWGRMEEWTWGRARWVDGPSVCKYVRGAHCIAISAPSALRLFEGSTVHRRHGPSDGGTHQLSCSRPPSGRGPLVCGWRSAGLHVGLVGHGTVLHGPTEHDMSSIASNCTLGPSGGGNPAGEGRRDLGGLVVGVRVRGDADGLRRATLPSWAGGLAIWQRGVHGLVGRASRASSVLACWW